ncbi:AIPR family protein [Pectinatus frisingensis]|uniref:AIPR family protein n=1 Tax=Pectinatus frisingensis TaxID=865 RepID=UPI0018C8137D|nr:AIPR family protein [Pectinatus frisingensis]
MTYEESELSSSKSYIISMTLIDLIRITCTDTNLRDNFNITDLAALSNASLSQDVLFDNVRGYLGATKFNNNIVKTINENPSKFFMYNNGITITAKNIIAATQNAKTKVHMTLSEFQIVNGGQTLRSIYESA